ncbi:MAG: RluA family pseudouridine synthase [Bdellovibrionales bacterium]|nr:RluA family pseudouridine synthase [Bdellovibrionales bacterium]
MSDDQSETTLSFTFEGPGYERLDEFLLRELQSLSSYERLTRSQLKRWIASGSVEVNDAVETKSGARLKPGYDVVFLGANESDYLFEPCSLPLSLCHEDEDLLVINKPAGLVVHPGAGNKTGTLIQAVAGYLEESSGTFLGKHFEGSFRPGVVHRLDADTTGLLVVAKNAPTHQALAKQFAERTIDREYVALALSTPRRKRAIDQNESGVIDASVGRAPHQRVKMAVVADGGKRAVTHWSVTERFPWATLLKLKLETGRTHQIRVHMDYIGSPLIGDPTYGDFSALPKALKEKGDLFGRQALHAAVLGFTHPASGERLRFEEGPPDDFLELIDSFRRTQS